VPQRKKLKSFAEPAGTGIVGLRYVFLYAIYYSDGCNKKIFDIY
jgi:hypothetical protein